MVNINYGIPVLLAASYENRENNIELLSKIKEFLPKKFYTHIDKQTLEAVFKEDIISDLEEYMNMGLCDHKVLSESTQNDVQRLTFTDYKDIKELIKASYPEAWLDEEHVKLNENFGIYKDGKLVSFTGIHAYSNKQQVVAIAHITTHPDYRKKGYAEKVVTEQLKSLNVNFKFIGLNVKANNFAAIGCYKKLGFKDFGKFMSCEIEMRDT